GLYPYTKRYLGTFNNHFSTIGLIGMNEVGLNANWLKKDMTHVETQEFTKKVLNFMREKLSDYQELYGDLYNLEATPAESTTYRLAMHDKKRYPDIITASQGATPYYTNSSHLPVNFTSDIFDALDIQDELQTLYTSGTVFHAFLGEKLPDWKSAANLVRKIAENYKLPYYTLSPTYSVCKNHGYLAGEHFKCPICGETAEVYSRITGYYRPVQNWNDGKRQEYEERKEYDIAHSVLKKGGVKNEPIVEEAPAQAERCDEKGIKLFATKTCPNCKMAAAMLDKAGIPYEKIYAEDNKDLVAKYKIVQAPTLIVQDENGITEYRNASNIKKYVESVKA
ncbi:MAG: ribonucleoside triphosphate reductase, partial [Clostridia bacterium]|nr:ribonucleoside triphosphate reductase [Clostridia bacterium]